MKRERILSTASAFLSTYRKAERGWLAKVKQENTLQCREGCTHCCYQLPIGTLVSGVLIAEVLGRLHPERLEAIKAQGDRQVQVFADHGMEAAAEVYFQEMHQPCELLQEGRCLVYDLRPPMCSSYYVVSDPGLCKKATAATIVKAPNNSELTMMSLQLDGVFLATIFDDPSWEEEVVLSPMGTMVKAGEKLLEQGQAAFEDLITPVMLSRGRRDAP